MFRITILMVLLGDVHMIETDVSADGKVDVEKYPEDCPENQDMLIYFDNIPNLKEDLTQLKWAQSVNSVIQLKEALENNEVHMIEADVSSDGNSVIVGRNTGAAQEDTFLLESFLQQVEEHLNVNADVRKGLKLNFKQTSDFEIAAGSSGQKFRYMDIPLWIHADVVDVQAGEVITVLDYETHFELLSCRQVSLGWTGDLSEPEYPVDLIDKMKQESQKFIDALPRFYSVRALYLPKSWENLKKKLEGKFILWAPQTDLESVEYAKIMPIISQEKDNIFIDVSDDFDTQLYSCPPKQNIFTYFNIDNLGDDLSKLKWKQSVNTAAELELALSDIAVHMIEADVRYDGKKLLMGPDREWGETNFFFVDFLEKVEDYLNTNLEVRKGLKLNFQSTDVFENAAILQDNTILRDLNIPLWIHADVIQGQAGTEVTDLQYEKHKDLIDCRQLSLGWTGDQTDNKYTSEQITKMKDESKKYGTAQPIYSVRARNLPDSWSDLENILVGKFTLWSFETDNVIDYSALRAITSKSKNNIFMDVSDEFNTQLYSCPTKQDVFTYFNIDKLEDDLSKLKWKQSVNTAEDLQTVLSGDVKYMIGADVGSAGENVRMGMNNAAIEKAFTLEDFLEQVEAHLNGHPEARIGLKLNFQSTDAFKNTVESPSGTKLRDLNIPLWIHADVIQGQAGTEVTDLQYEKHKDLIDCRQLSLGWTGDQTDNKYTSELINKMKDEIIKYGTAQPIYSVRARYLPDSWSDLEYILVGKFTLWSFETDNVIDYSALRAITSKSKNNIFMDVSDDFNTQLYSCPTKQDVFTYFNIDNLEDDLSKLKWKQSVNTVEDLEKALSSDVKYMIGADVSYDGKNAIMGTGNAVVDNSFSLEDFLEQVDVYLNEHLEARIGLKLNFLSTDAFQNAANSPGGKKLRDLNIPLWIHADVIQGQEGTEVTDLQYEKHKDLIDCRQLSLGWTGDQSENIYTSELIDAMKAECTKYNSSEPPIYAVRALNLPKSWQNLKQKLEGKFVIWSPEADLQSVKYAKIRHITSKEKDNIFMDVSCKFYKYLLVCPIKQDVFTYFCNILNLTDDFSQPKWVQSTNSASKLKETLQSIVFSLEIENVPAIQGLLRSRVLHCMACCEEAGV